MKNTLRIALLVGLMAGLAVPSMAHAETWAIDGAHSNIGFKVRHMMVSWTRGNFGTAEGTVTIDGKDLKTLKVDVTIDTSSIDTDNEKRDEHLKSADFFDVETFPTMTFKSTKVKPQKGGTFDLVGDLTLHGVTKSVTLKADGFVDAMTDPWGNVKTGTSASVTINRADFGLTWNKALETGGLVVGEDVHIQLDIELNQQK